MSQEVIGFYDSTNYFNKIEKNALYLIEQLKERGNNVLVFANEASPLHSSAKEKSIPLSIIDESKTYINLILSYRLAKAVRNRNCNILVILRPHDLITAIMTRIIFYRKLKLVFFQQLKFHLRKNYLLYSLLFRPFDAWIVSMANYQEQVLDISNYPKEKIFHLPQGIDPDHYGKDTLSQQTARKILKLPENIELIGVLGRHHIEYRQDFLIRAIQLLRKHKYKVDLLIMGRARDKDEKEYFGFLKELSKECEVEDFIHFRSFAENELTFFKAIDIYTQIASDDMNGKYMLKAMVSLRPIIACFNDDNNEILEQGKYGILYHHNDLEDFTAKIIRLLTQSKIKSHLTTVASNIVYEKYSIHKRCEKFEMIINKITSS